MCNPGSVNILPRSFYFPITLLTPRQSISLWEMKQLSKRTVILEDLQLQSGRQASRQQQASSPQAPVDRIRLLCSRLLLLLRENEKVAPAAWQGAQSLHTNMQITSTHACMDSTHNNTCAYLHTDTCRLGTNTKITFTVKPETCLFSLRHLKVRFKSHWLFFIEFRAQTGRFSWKR